MLQLHRDWPLRTGALLIALIFCALSEQGNAGTLYAARAAGSSGELYILDQSTGALIQDIGPLNDVSGANYPITGLAFNPISGVLYGSTGNSNTATAARLVTINPATAEVAFVGLFNVGNVGNPSTMADIAFDANGNLFGVGSIAGPQLYSINSATGQATLVGGTGLTSTAGGALAISPTGTFFGAPTSTRFGTYNSGTGAYTDIANPTKPVGGTYAAMAFDGTVLYGLNLGTVITHLVTFNTSTGAVTDIGASIDQLDAIAFTNVPEPSTLALAAFGGVALLGYVRHQRRRVVR